MLGREEGIDRRTIEIGILVAAVVLAVCVVGAVLWGIAYPIVWVVEFVAARGASTYARIEHVVEPVFWLAVVPIVATQITALGLIRLQDRRSLRRRRAAAVAWVEAEFARPVAELPPPTGPPRTVIDDVEFYEEERSDP